MNEETLTEGIPMPEYVEPIKKKQVFTRGEKLLAGATALLGLGFVHFTLRHPTGFFTTGLYVCIITLAVLMLRRSGKELGRFHKVWTGVLYLFSLVFSITGNPFIKGLDVIFLLFGGGYLVFSVWTGKQGFGELLPLDMAASTVTPMGRMGTEFSAVGAAARDTKAGGRIGGMIGGLLLAVPLTLVVGSLLMSADDGVERILLGALELLDPDSFWDVVWEILLSLPAGAYLFGMLWTGLHPDEKTVPTEEGCRSLRRRLERLSVTAVCTAVTPICVLYVIFFFSQASYFLSAFIGRLPEAMSYAEYARKGFFELFAIEIINGLVLLFICFLSKKEDGSKPTVLKVYTVMLSLFTIIMSVIALSKMFLYIENFGLTQLRIYTSWFMGLTALIFLYVIIKELRPGFKAMSWAAWTFTVMFAVLCFSRPDALMTRFNLEERAENLTNRDVSIMLHLSEDSAAVLLEDRYAGLLRDLGCDRAELEEIAQGMVDRDPYARFNISSMMLEQELG